MKIKFTTACGAVGFLHRFDPNCHYAIMVSFDERAQDEFAVRPLVSYNLHGQSTECGAESEFNLDGGYFPGVREKQSLATLVEYLRNEKL